MQRIIVVLVMMLLAGPAFAEGLERGRIAAPFATSVQEWSWAGIYFDAGVGGHAGIANLNIEKQSEETAFLNGFGAWDWAGNARAGFNVQPQGSPFVFGAFAGYSLGSVAAEFGSGDDGTEGELTPTWDFGAIVGIVGPGKSLLYGGYRYQMAEFDLRGTGQNDLSGDCETSLRCSHDLEGHGLIAGIKMPVSPAFAIGLEYGYTKFDDIELSQSDTSSLRLEPEVHTVMLRGSVLLGPNLFGQ